MCVPARALCNAFPKGTALELSVLGSFYQEPLASIRLNLSQAALPAPVLEAGTVPSVSQRDTEARKVKCLSRTLKLSRRAECRVFNCCCFRVGLALVSLCSLGYPAARSVDQAGVEVAQLCPALFCLPSIGFKGVPHHPTLYFYF